MKDIRFLIIEHIRATAINGVFTGTQATTSEDVGCSRKGAERVFTLLGQTGALERLTRGSKLALSTYRLTEAYPAPETRPASVVTVEIPRPVAQRPAAVRKMPPDNDRKYVAKGSYPWGKRAIDGVV